jgi:Flp pilus assembly protein TadB
LKMPLSEEEQRILHEMEQKLYEHDRGFADRVSTAARRHRSGRSGRSGRGSVLVFFLGLVLLLVSFSWSVLLGSVGFLIMLFAALAFAHHAGSSTQRLGKVGRALRGGGVAEEWSEMRRRIWSRFGNRHS